MNTTPDTLTTLAKAEKALAILREAMGEAAEGCCIHGAACLIVSQRDNARTCEEAHAAEVKRLQGLILAERKRYAEAEAALIDARASFLGLQPDTGGPIAAQMGKAIARINDLLNRHKLERTASPRTQQEATT